MFLETYPCLTLYPTLCFQKQLMGRGICTFPDPQVRCTLHYKWRVLWDIPWNFGSNWFSGHAIILYVLGSQTISALYSSHLQTYQAASKAYISFSEFSMIASVWWIMHRVALYQKQLLQWFASFKKKTNCTVVDVTRKQLLRSREQLTRHLYGDVILLPVNPLLPNVNWVDIHVEISHYECQLKNSMVACTILSDQKRLLVILSYLWDCNSWSSLVSATQSVS